MRFLDHIGAGNLFHQLSDDETKRFKEKFQTRHIPAGEYVFRENEMGDSLFIVEKGVVKIKRNITIDVEKDVYLAHEGTIFGEFSFMDACERSASAIVEEDAELLSLKREDFDAFVSEYPVPGTKLYGNLLYILVERLRRTNDAYRDAIRWGLELSGTLKLNFQYLITEGVDICIELTSSRVFEGRIIQLEKSDAGYEIILLDRDSKLVMLPYHAIASITLSQ